MYSKALENVVLYVFLVSGVFGIQQICNPSVVNCPPFSCNGNDTCLQICANRQCPEMACNSGSSCQQICFNCSSTMTCSSKSCKQSCSSRNCNMKCSPNVETCEQLCPENSTCNIECDKDKTNCETECKGNCPGIEKPIQENEICSDKVCNITCKNGCEKKSYTCRSEECRMSCDGCTMICENTVKRCHRTCIGENPCKGECKAEKCYKQGKFRNSSFICRLNNFALIFALLLLYMLND
ncbi:keratin-associated protein 4-5-like [Xenia sp. Carnegie-2017]|uniref:keratin-associated protein 4-5-like n=1 Tax=Xenia sp. Carnegie-2017 TaxID=2897299 RepID=UPI001F03868C|nr:keratin-associated protein 4-5-like [Xenia sp. Carnegie-2017]